ncbi:MAG TPA: STAS domain-containing protein [Solirubrobacteraceae bacterium]|nr:STAS domain-containing protein [Solirubrobacteraceae bacterium]
MCPGCEASRNRVSEIVITIEPVATELSINRREEAGGVVLALSGELDVVSAPELEQHLNELLSRPDAHVTLDLGELTFVDSAGVSMLIKAKQDAKSNGRTLVLAKPTEQVQRVFALVGLTDWLSD